MKRLIIIFISVITIFTVTSCDKNANVTGNTDNSQISGDMVRVVIYDEIYTDEYAQQLAYSVEKTRNNTVYLFTKENYDTFIANMHTKVKTMLENSFDDRVRKINTNEDLSEIYLSISSDDYKGIESTVERATEIVANQAFKYQLYRNADNAKLKIIYFDIETDDVLYEYSLTN